MDTWQWWPFQGVSNWWQNMVILIYCSWFTKNSIGYFPQGWKLLRMSHKCYRRNSAACGRLKSCHTPPIQPIPPSMVSIRGYWSWRLWWVCCSCICSQLLYHHTKLCGTVILTGGQKIPDHWQFTVPQLDTMAINLVWTQDLGEG